MTGIPSNFRDLSKAIQFAELEHRVFSQNIANVNTPDYKTKETSKAAFDSFLENDSPGAALDESQVVQEAKGLLERTDGNNVDLDQQVSNLKRNAMLFQTFSNLLAAKMDTMKRAMNG